ncbi:hypothetical protein [Cytophaga aurantiaca]|uniref:hypothetical protein n=1 Tax=Cytophaga aurantiaca TaxID=29530 RepID=UPI000363D5A9|nr:hypothetical protein [Cytophaga aurantiaca]
MFGKKFYYDDPEGDALAKETSHPNFVKNMTADFYYDCTYDFSPFGNDDGADLLFNLEEFYQEKKGKGIIKWLFKTIDEFGFKYVSEGCSKNLDEATLKKLQEEDPHFITCMDNTIIAAAFGQIKISGQVDTELKDLAKIAIQRQLILNRQYDGEITTEHNNILNTMLTDLNKI